MRAGNCNKWVTLSRWPADDALARGAALTPPGVWVAIEPTAPGDSITDRTTTHVVRMRFHPQVTLDTKISYVDARLGRTRSLFVRGVQDVNDAGDEMRLLCEEVAP
jgi:hypothetical protein